MFLYFIYNRFESNGNLYVTTKFYYRTSLNILEIFRSLI